MSSIRLRLLRWLIGPILLINLAGGALTYLLAWMPAQLAFDQSLAAAAGALASRLRTGPGGVMLDLPAPAEQVLRADAADVLYFVVRLPDGRRIAGDADLPALPASAALQAADARMRGEPVRVLSQLAEVGGRPVVVAVAKTLRKRGQIRAATVRALLLLEALFSLLLIGLIWFSVTNGLLPLNRMRADLNAREADDLAPIEAEQVPYELSPVVGAFNELLAKVQAGARAQHDFLANVAHQLRTPLAGLKMQLEWLGQRHAGEPETVHSVQLMLGSTERMIRQTKQLLALARAEPSHFEKTRRAPLDLAELVGEAVQVFVEQAGRKRIDLGFELAPAPVSGEHFLLRDLIDNLIDNALRYTPAEGTVTVSCRAEAQGSVLRVEDSGPGIPAERREQVFNRYVRLDDKSSGNGLGLAIVREIALAHGATLSLGERAGGGAVFVVRFPPGQQ